VLQAIRKSKLIGGNWETDWRNKRKTINMPYIIWEMRNVSYANFIKMNDAFVL